MSKRAISLTILVAFIVLAVTSIVLFGQNNDSGTPVAPGVYHEPVEDDSTSDDDTGSDGSGDVDVDVR